MVKINALASGIEAVGCQRTRIKKSHASVRRESPNGSMSELAKPRPPSFHPPSHWFAARAPPHKKSSLNIMVSSFLSNSRRPCQNADSASAAFNNTIPLRAQRGMDRATAGEHICVVASYASTDSTASESPLLDFNGIFSCPSNPKIIANANVSAPPARHPMVPGMIS